MDKKVKPKNLHDCIPDGRRPGLHRQEVRRVGWELLRSNFDRDFFGGLGVPGGEGASPSASLRFAMPMDAKAGPVTREMRAAVPIPKTMALSWDCALCHADLPKNE